MALIAALTSPSYELVNRSCAEAPPPAPAPGAAYGPSFFKSYLANLVVPAPFDRPGGARMVCNSAGCHAEATAAAVDLTGWDARGGLLLGLDGFLKAFGYDPAGPTPAARLAHFSGVGDLSVAGEPGPPSMAATARAAAALCAAGATDPCGDLVDHFFPALLADCPRGVPSGDVIRARDNAYVRLLGRRVGSKRLAEAGAAEVTPGANFIARDVTCAGEVVEVRRWDAETFFVDNRSAAPLSLAALEARDTRESQTGCGTGEAVGDGPPSIPCAAFPSAELTSGIRAHDLDRRVDLLATLMALGGDFTRGDSALSRSFARHVAARRGRVGRRVFSADADPLVLTLLAAGGVEAWLAGRAGPAGPAPAGVPATVFSCARFDAETDPADEAWADPCGAAVGFDDGHYRRCAASSAYAAAFTNGGGKRAVLAACAGLERRCSRWAGARGAVAELLKECGGDVEA